LTRYLKKDDILNEITGYDESIRDCMFLFQVICFIFHTHDTYGPFKTGIQARILQLMLKPSTQQTTALLLAPVEANPPLPELEDHLEALDLAIFTVDPEDAALKDDVSSLSEKLRQVQETENEVDRARDIEDLGRVLHLALNAPSHLAVTRILQISKPDMPAAIMVLLRELEMQQQERPNSPASTSPSPRIRALTWPLDGVPARQVALLHRQFMEYELEALKRTVRDYGVSSDAGSPSLLSGTFQRFGKIQVSPPCERSLSDLHISEPS
jgi:hypothetical protein